MPSADFCAAFGGAPPSRQSDHKGHRRPPRRPPEVSSTACGAQPPDLRPAFLMDMDFAVNRPLVPRSRLFLSGFCPSARAFAPRFFRTQPRGWPRPCGALPFTAIRLAGDFHPQAAEHARHTILTGRLDSPRCTKVRRTIRSEWLLASGLVSL